MFETTQRHLLVIFGTETKNRSKQNSQLKLYFEEKIKSITVTVNVIFKFKFFNTF